MKYLNIVKNWAVKKWNGNPFDKFVLLAVILIVFTGLIIIFN
jgi:hypothetical protein